jgi:DNA-binding transcriptional LysR family regulator
MDGDKTITVRPQGRFKADNGAALVAATVAGLGIGYLPTILVQEHLRSGALVHVMPRYPVIPAAAYVVRPPGQHPAKKIRILAELLIEYFETMPDVARAGTP